MSEDYRWAAVEKDADETMAVELSLFGMCANFWAPNEEHQLGNFRWPVIEVEGEDGVSYPSGIGHCFEVTQAGRTGAIQPRFANADRTGPSVAVDTALPKLDGSVQWTCRSPGAGGISVATLADPSYSAPTDIVIAAIVVNEGTKLFVDYQGGVTDEDYEVLFRFVIAGRLRIGRQVVKVRKK